LDTVVAKQLGDPCDVFGRSYPDGLPALLTNSDGELLYFPKPATEPTVGYPIDNYDLSKFLEPGRADRLSTELRTRKR
jgi:hypothetical protein